MLLNDPFSLLDLSPILEGAMRQLRFGIRSICTTCRELGISSLLAGRTSQFAEHRERGDQRRHWLRRGWSQNDSCRCRWHHVAEPCPARLCGTIRYTRIALSGSDRSGTGRAPGTDQATARALRRYFESADSFPEDLLELMLTFARQTWPARDSNSGCRTACSDFSSGLERFQRATRSGIGLPFGFASHFAPDYLHTALEIYRHEFKPSPDLEKPYVMIGAGLYAADSDEEAQRIFTSAQLQTLNIIRGNLGKLQPLTRRSTIF